MFVKAPILYYIDLEHDIWVKTDVSGYAINKVFSQLTLDDLSQWHLVAFFSWKMISAATRYNTYDGKLLTFVKTFKI